MRTFLFRITSVVVFACFLLHPILLRTAGSSPVVEEAGLPQQNGERVIVVTNRSGSSLSQFAVRELKGSIRQNLKKEPTVVESDKASDDLLTGDLIIIGTAEGNDLVRRLVESSFIEREKRIEGYSLRIDENPKSNGRFLVVIAGADEKGMLYGTMDFLHFHIGKMVGKLYRVKVQDAPRIEKRGLWTWAGRIYNYEAYLDNMARWKMNTLTVWHRFPPANGKALAEYARRRGIDVVWGYTWGWGMPVCPSSPVERAQWKEFVLKMFDEHYAPIGAKGVYFQTFTETSDKNRFCRYGGNCPNGCRDKSAGELLVGWVNPIIEALLAKHPDVWIACGVHASALRESLADIAKIDRRANLMWEDVGSFPFAYSPGQVEMGEFQSTTDFSYRLATLRGSDEDIAFVFKGMFAAWGGFDAMLQEKNILEKLTEQRVPTWREVEVGWKQNLGYELQIGRMLSTLNVRRKSIMGLVEDGLWESRQWFAVAAFAESIWNPHVEADELIERLDACGDVVKLQN
jgi:hypothetical protein